MNAAIDAPHRADYFGMSGMSDQNDLTPLIGIALAFDVHFRDQRTGCIDHRKPALAGALLDRARDPVRAEDGHGTRRDLVDLVDEMRTLGS